MSSEKAKALLLGYILGYNCASSEALEKIKQAYRKGLKDGDNGRGEITEDITEDLPPDKKFDVEIDEEGNTVEPYIGNLENGVFLTGGSGIPDGGYLKIYLDKAYEKYYEASNSSWFGRLIYELYDENGNITATEWKQDQPGWKDYWYKTGKTVNWTTKFKFNYPYRGEVMGYWYESTSGYTYTSKYWSPYTTAIVNALANATTLKSTI